MVECFSLMSSLATARDLFLRFDDGRRSDIGSMECRTAQLWPDCRERSGEGTTSSLIDPWVIFLVPEFSLIVVVEMLCCFFWSTASVALIDQ